MEDSAVAVVFDFDGGVDAADGGEFGALAVVGGGDDFEGLAGFEGVRKIREVEAFAAGEVEGAAALAFPVDEWEDAHADEIGAVDAFERFGDDGFDAEELDAFGGPVA